MPRTALGIEADDAHHSLRLEPVIRPAVENVRASIILPDYLERPDINADLRSGFITILEGSSIKIQTTTTRKLSSATAKVITLPKDADHQAGFAPPPWRNTSSRS